MGFSVLCGCTIPYAQLHLKPFQLCRHRLKSTVNTSLLFLFHPTLGFLKGTHSKSSDDHFTTLSKKVLGSLKAGATLKHVVLSPLLLAVFLLCILVHMCNHSSVLSFRGVCCKCKS